MKKYCIITMIFLFMFSTSVSAHNVLEKSSPAEDEIIVVDIDRISLTFDTKVEKLISLELKSEGGEAIAVNDILINDNQSQIEGFISSDLIDGTYTVLWNIIGADAHPIQGEYSFIMNKGNTIDQQATPNTIEVKPELNESIEDPKSILSSTNIMYAAIIIMFVVGAGTLIWLLRRGKK